MHVPKWKDGMKTRRFRNKYCYDCVFFKNIGSQCAKGYEMKFHNPTGIIARHCGDWGYYRDNCKDWRMKND